MNSRERFIATLTFQKPDRIPFAPGWGRKSTLEAWHKQGLPPEVNDYSRHIRDMLGMPEPSKVKWVTPGLEFRMIPQFEEKVLEHRKSTNPGAGVPGVLVVQDWKGNVCEISDEFTVEYLRNAIDFVTRSWVRCPVESRKDWPDMARRYDATDPRHFPANFSERVSILKDRDYQSGFTISGPFWQLREWCGFEGLCMMMIDDPDFVLEMIKFWEQFVVDLLERVFASGYAPDIVTINEDMAYKEKPMIGPEQTRKFCLPTWKRWNELLAARGVRVREVDSDGHVGLLIPSFIEGGFNCNSPLEVAAGNDLPAYRQTYGTKIAWQGGVDKRKMAQGGKALRDEMARLQPVIDAGGYIPSCDHGVPADVSWPNYVEFCKLLAKATGWTS